MKKCFTSTNKENGKKLGFVLHFKREPGDITYAFDILNKLYFTSQTIYFEYNFYVL